MTQREAWLVVCCQLMLRNRKAAEQLGWTYRGRVGGGGKGHRFVLVTPGATLELIVGGNEIRR